MTEKTTNILLGLIVCCLLALIALRFTLFLIEWTQRDAIKAGHAEYYLDAHHVRQWRWLTNCHHAETITTNR